MQALAGLGQVALVRRPQQELLDRLAQRAVPVLVEAVRQLLGHRADGQQVDVGEVAAGFGVEVFVAEVAPADDGRAAVGQPQLVVHAPVLLAEVQRAAEHAGDAGGAAQVQRVEHPHLDVGVGGEQGDLVVAAVAAGVVQQQAHAHAPVGGAQHLVDQRAGAEAVMHDVVLQVEAAARRAHQLGTGGEGLVAGRQQAKARLPLVAGREVVQLAAERGFGGRQGLARLDGGRRGAGGEQRQQADQQGAVHDDLRSSRRPLATTMPSRQRFHQSHVAQRPSSSRAAVSPTRRTATSTSASGRAA